MVGAGRGEGAVGGQGEGPAPLVHGDEVVEGAQQDQVGELGLAAGGLRFQVVDLAGGGWGVAAREGAVPVAGDDRAAHPVRARTTITPAWSVTSSMTRDDSPENTIPLSSFMSHTPNHATRNESCHNLTRCNHRKCDRAEKKIYGPAQLEQARGNIVEQELFPFGCLEPSHVAASWVLGDEQDAVEVGSDCVQVADDGDQAAGGDVAAEHVECFGEDRCVEGAEPSSRNNESMRPPLRPANSTRPSASARLARNVSPPDRVLTSRSVRVRRSMMEPSTRQRERLAHPQPGPDNC